MANSVNQPPLKPMRSGPRLVLSGPGAPGVCVAEYLGGETRLAVALLVRPEVDQVLPSSRTCFASAFWPPVFFVPPDSYLEPS